MRWNYILITAAATVLLAPAPATAQVDTSEWKCEYCPFEDGYRADYEAGGSYVSEDAARFGNGTGLDEKGAYADVGGEGRYVSNGSEFHWYAEDLGLDSRVFALGFGKAGRYDINLGYRELPYRRFGDTQTVYSGNSEILNLPPGWVAAGTTGGMTQLSSSLAPRNIETDRQILDFGVGVAATSSLSFYADYRRQQREATGIMAGSGFTNATYLPRPVDDYTDTMDLGAKFSLGDLSLNLAYYGSFYRNELESLTWDNPFTPLPGADQGRLALEPENDFQQVSVSGVYRARSFDTIVAFSFASGRGEQNASLLPYTINPILVTSPLPATSLDAEVDTSNYALTVTSRPLDKLSLRVAYRYDERDNNTPIYSWTRVITDSFLSGTTEQNTPYSFERGRLNLSGTYRLFDTVTISGGYDRTDYDRDFQEVASQTEDAGWGKLRLRPNRNVDVTVKGGASRREVDAYDTDVGLTFGQNPLMRKYNLAHRNRQFAELRVSASLTETPVSIAASYLWAEDDYSKSDLGLIEGSDDRFTVDFSWAATESASIYVTAGSEVIESVQIGSETFAAPVWQADHEDEFVFYGGGFTVAGMDDKLDLTFDYTRSEGETDISYSGMAVSATPLPDLESTMDALRMTLRYSLSERFDLNLGARYERFKAEDWALQDVAPDTVPSLLTMGANPYDYDVWVFSIGFRYSVGADSES